ncbi:MAG: glycogen debranching protein, partial [Mucilaginibacter sp.]
IPAAGYYGQYLYGRNYSSLSPRSEALGEALTVLFDVASRQQQQSIIAKTPVTNYGIPCIYPQIPGILPYHNNAVWPFVETYWAMASAKAGNEASLIRAISAVYRPGALFLTNKENFVAADGDYAGTQINSSNMLWSLSGNIAIIYKILFGLHYNENSLRFEPFVPKAMAGDRLLSNYHYRNALLDISLSGFGNKIKSITIDGAPVINASIPASITGKHIIKILLADNTTGGTSNLQPNYTAPETPVVALIKSRLTWAKTHGATGYRIIKDGKYLYTTTNTNYTVVPGTYAEYQVASIDEKGVTSFNSEPVAVSASNNFRILQAEDFASPSVKPYQGYTGSGFVEVSKHKNTILKFKVDVRQNGYYAFDLRYANGNGPINTENKCAIRTLNVDGKFAGTYVLPQRGKDVWSAWGFTNSIKIHLTKGSHIVSLAFEPANENMNGDINEAMIDYVRVINIGL